jgi:hypothetical protein
MYVENDALEDSLDGRARNADAASRAVAYL